MNTEIYVHYDEESDTLEILSDLPDECSLHGLGNGFFEQLNARTGEVVGVAVVGVREKAREGLLRDLRVQLPAKMLLPVVEFGE